jgi:hypothetical protein
MDVKELARNLASITATLNEALAHGDLGAIANGVAELSRFRKVLEAGEGGVREQVATSRLGAEAAGFDERTFAVSGRIDVSRDAEPELDHTGSICAFYLPDGRRVRLAVALEVEDVGGIEYITDQAEMETLGFQLIDYLESKFEE